MNILSQADPTRGWQLRYRIAIAGIGLALIAGSALLISPPRADASIAAVPPQASYVGQSYFTPWRFTYRYASSREYSISYHKAASSSTWQTTSTWPRGRLAIETRTEYVWNGNYWDVAEAWVRMTGLFNLWGIECRAQYRWDFHSVFTDGSNTCRTWGFGFPVSYEKVTWNEGGQNWGYLTFGADYNVSAVWDGLPVHFGHWMRLPVYTNGSTGTMRGA